MGCCAAYGNRVEPLEPSSQALEGPVKDRTCRDVLFLVLFICFIGGMCYVSYLGFISGNPNRLIYGTDSWGNVCSQNNDKIPGSNLSGQDMGQRPVIFYYDKDFLKDISSGNYLTSSSVSVCVSTCPNSTLTTVQHLQDFATTYDSRLCQYDVQISQYYSGDVNGTGTCPPLPVEATTEIFHRCIPNSLTSVFNQFGEVISSVLNLIDQDFSEKSYSDLQKTWQDILYLTSFALALSVVIIVLLRFFAGVLVWSMVIIMILASLAGTGFCWYSYYVKLTRNWLIGSIVATVVCLIVLLILLVMRKRIALAVQLFKEAGKAVGRMPVLLLQPFLTLTVRGGTAAGLVYLFLYLVTAKSTSVNDNNGHVVFTDDPKMNYLMAYYVLGFLWIMEFIVGCERMLISGAVVRWYFTRNKDDLNWPISKSYKTMIRYHLGSIALGSLLIALVQFVRLIVSFIDGRLRGKENPVAQVLLKMLSCCLWCFEKFLKFLNANAYIEIAIHGYSFCKAAKSAMSVIIKNVLRVAAVNCVGDFLLFVGKAGTVAIVAVVGIEMFRDRVDINYVWLPITVACIISYLLSSCFLSVYEMTIDAIFICFVEDCDMNDGEKNPYFMSKSLMKYVNGGKLVDNKEGKEVL
ncbi:hypothetical protein SNE40_012702 [Patella caerulea]|uniref:Choline transporter-like protein n=1 Tax=Patella caerulea TaxID=87958 RepID=A0AAN8JMH6_PATCE